MGVLVLRPGGRGPVPAHGVSGALGRCRWWRPVRQGPARLGALHRGSQPLITGTSSGSLPKLVNKTDYVKAESVPAAAGRPPAARGEREPGADGAARPGSTARRGR